jgi:hypothetical protein
MAKGDEMKKKTGSYTSAHEVTILMRHAFIEATDTKNVISVYSLAALVAAKIDPKKEAPKLMWHCAESHLVAVAASFCRNGERATDSTQEPLFDNDQLQWMYPSFDKKGEYRTLDMMREADFDAAILRAEKHERGSGNQKRLLTQEKKVRKERGQFDGKAQA